MDELWEHSEMQKLMATSGFLLITDNIDARFQGIFELGEVASLGTKTRDFVGWIMLRKIGAIARGISSINMNHIGSSVITSWSWCPNAAYAMSMEQPCVIPDDEALAEAKKALLDKVSVKMGDTLDRAEKLLSLDRLKKEADARNKLENDLIGQQATPSKEDKHSEKEPVAAKAPAEVAQTVRQRTTRTNPAGTRGNKVRKSADVARTRIKTAVPGLPWGS
jgi:hypothetical protein